MESDDQSIYVCLYKDNGLLVAHAVSSVNDFSETIEEEKTQLPPDSRSTFSGCFERFVDDLIGFFEFASLIAGFSASMPSQMSDSVHRRFIQQHGTPILVEKNREIYRLPAHVDFQIRDTSHVISSIVTSGRIVRRMLFVGLVSTYELYLRRLIRIIVSKSPHLLGKDKTISVADIFSYQSLEDVKTAMVDAEIDNIIRGGMEAQIEWIERKCNIDKISTNFDRWPELVEIFKRRNLFVHADGIVDDNYLSWVNTNKININSVDKSHSLEVGSTYFSHSVALIAEFGAKLIQIVWRKLEKDGLEQSDDVLTHFGFELISRGYYSIAERLLEFGISMREHSSDRVKRMMIINLANAAKLNNNPDKAVKILASVDWSASSDDFNLCRHAILSDVDEVVTLMGKIGNNSSVGQKEYQSWPVFFHVRDDDRFKQTFLDVFSVVYAPEPVERATLTQFLRLMAGKPFPGSTGASDPMPSELAEAPQTGSRV